MDSGLALPMYILLICCVIGTPITGIIFLIFTFHKDRQLFKNILITTLTAAILAMIFPVLVSILEFLSTLLDYISPPTQIHFLWILEELSKNLKDTLFLIFPSLTIGFIVSIITTVPATFIVRILKKKSKSD